MRIGIGYDVHALVPGRPLIIGGVRIDYEKGLLGHSDADVLVHAVCDALLGAAALEDIGSHFPDSDERFHNIDSLKLLAHTRQLLQEQHFQISNIDSIIMAQKPKMAPHIQQMRENIARTLELDISRVSIKATTTERLGFVGHEEGMAAQAAALLSEMNGN